MRRALLAGLVVVFAGALGWWGSDRLEERDAFCTSCHLPSGAPLHSGNAADFRARPAATLAAAHAAAGNAAREDGSFRCFDCHSGTGLLGRARVKLLTLRDGVVYLTRRFDEPRGMRWPLLDEDCRKCHAEFAAPAGASDAWRPPPFHALSVHNRELGVTCVACHLAHPAGGLVEQNFLHASAVRTECARCHPELEEGAP